MWRHFTLSIANVNRWKVRPVAETRELRWVTAVGRWCCAGEDDDVAESRCWASDGGTEDQRGPESVTDGPTQPAESRADSTPPVYRLRTVRPRKTIAHWWRSWGTLESIDMTASRDQLPSPPVDIVWPVTAVWRIRLRELSEVFCAVYDSCAQW